MFAKIMHHFVFLIITFSPFAACIRNENLIDKPKSPLKQYDANYVANRSPPPDDTQLRTDVVESRGKSSFAFPQDNPSHQSRPNDDVSARHSPKDLYHSSNYEPQSLHTMDFNMDEVPSTQNGNRYGSANRNMPNVPKQYYRQPSTSPNYIKPPYAPTHGNFIYNKAPSFYQPIRPTPPPAPPTLTSQYPSYQTAYPHQTQPYQNPDEDQFGGTYSLFGGQFGSLPFSNALSALLGQPGGGGSNSQLGGQLIKGLESIARNDDLNCVPKLLCVMVGNPQRRAQLPAFITSPAIQSLIAIIPAASPAFTFGRAALLGLSGGENSCYTTYSKCPHNEDDLLYYLNNHRGGFFRFFSEPGSAANNFGGQHDQNHQHQPNRYGAISSQSDSSNNYNQETAGFPLSLMSGTIGNLLGNVLSGLVGGPAYSGKNNSRRKRRASVDDSEHIKALETVKANSSTDGNIEGRILSPKGGRILAYDEDEPQTPLPLAEDFRFSSVDDDVFNFNSGRYAYEPTRLKFPDTAGSGDERKDLRNGKKVQFVDSNNSIREEASGQRMVFPDSDRTGTGSLRFDNEYFFAGSGNKHRFGRIINRPAAASSYNSFNYSEDYTTTRKPTYAHDDHYSPYVRNRSPTPQPENTEKNIYVTNSKGVVEYYINAQGRKVYI